MFLFWKCAMCSPSVPENSFLNITFFMGHPLLSSITVFWSLLLQLKHNSVYVCCKKWSTRKKFPAEYNLRVRHGVHVLWRAAGWDGCCPWIVEGYLCRWEKFSVLLPGPPRLRLGSGHTDSYQTMADGWLGPVPVIWPWLPSRCWWSTLCSDKKYTWPGCCCGVGHQ